MQTLNLFLLVVIFSLVIKNANSWHFLLTEGKTRCVSEQMMKNIVNDKKLCCEIINSFKARAN